MTSRFSSFLINSTYFEMESYGNSKFEPVISGDKLGKICFELIRTKLSKTFLADNGMKGVEVAKVWKFQNKMHKTTFESLLEEHKSDTSEAKMENCFLVTGDDFLEIVKLLSNSFSGKKEELLLSNGLDVILAEKLKNKRQKQYLVFAKYINSPSAVDQHKFHYDPSSDSLQEIRQKLKAFKSQAKIKKFNSVKDGDFFISTNNQYYILPELIVEVNIQFQYDFNEESCFVSPYSKIADLPTNINETFENAINCLYKSNISPFLTEMITNCKGDFKEFNIAGIDKTAFEMLKNSIIKLITKCFKYSSIDVFKQEDDQINERLKEINELSFSNFLLKDKENLEMIEKIEQLNFFNSSVSLIEEVKPLFLDKILSVKISNNLLTSLDLDIFNPIIKEIDLSHNLIKKLNYSGNYKFSFLDKLDISYNLLESPIALIEIAKINTIKDFSFHANPLESKLFEQYEYGSPNSYLAEFNTYPEESQIVISKENLHKYSKTELKMFELEYDIHSFNDKFLPLSDVDIITQQLNKKHMVLLNHSNVSIFPATEKGIEVKYLYLNNNLLKKIDNLRYFDHLQELYVQNNKITSLVCLPEITSLIKCDFSNNHIEELYGISSFPNLQVLVMENNRVRHFDGILELKNLVEIHLSANKIVSIRDCIELRVLSSLRVLDLTSNTVSLHEEFRVNMIYYCPLITNLNRALVTLEDVELSKEFFVGRLTPEIIEATIGLIPLNEIEEMNLSDNKLKDVEGMFNSTAYPRLKRLNLSKNKFSSLKIFGPMPQLQELNLSFNSFEKLLNRNDKNSQKYMINIQSVEKLDLTSNNMNDCSGIQQLQSLKIAILGTNSISKLESFDCMPSLIVLDLSNNRLRLCERNNVGLLPNLKILLLDNNYFKSLVGLSRLGNLVSLSAAGNKISELFGIDKLKEIHGLAEINLTNNPLVTISNYKNSILRRFPNLIKLDNHVVV